MTRGEARALMRLLAQDLGSRMPDPDCNAILHDAFIGYKTMHSRWDTVFTGNALWSIAAGATKGTTANNTGRFLRQLKSVHRQTTATGLHGVEMEWLPFEDLIRLQNDDTTQAAPRFYHAMMFDDGGLSGNDSPVEWRLCVWPIPDALYYFSGRGLIQADRIDADGDLLEVPDDETYLVVRDASRMMARLLGKSEEFVQGIDAQMEQRIAASKARAV